jgi:hypothetical protein
VEVGVAVGVGEAHPPALLRNHTSGRNVNVVPSKPPTLQISPFPLNPP